MTDERESKGDQVDEVPVSSWRERLTDLSDELPEAQRAAVARIERSLEQFQSFDIVSWVGVESLLIDPEHYSEAAHLGAAAHVEYVALQVLRKPYRSEGSQLATPDQQRDLVSDLRGLFTTELLQMYLRPLKSGGVEADDLDHLRLVTRQNELMVRSPGYPHHQADIIHGLFDPFSDDLRRVLRFDAADALCIAETIKDRTRNRLQERIDWARSGFKELERYIRGKRKGKTGKRPPGLTDEVLESFESLSNKELRRTTRRSIWPSVLVAIGDHLAFDAVEIATASGVPEDVVAAYLDRFALTFGEVPDIYAFPAPVHPLKQRPLLRNNEKYLCPIPDQLIWALRGCLEDELKQLGKTWHRYEQWRHSYVVEKTVELLSRVMPDCALDVGLEYPCPDGKHGDCCELDALGRYDSALFLIEAKGGGLRDIARKGVRDPFEDQIQDLVGEAHMQALRARDYILRSDLPTLEAKSGPVTLDMTDVSELLLIAVVLEPIGYLLSQMTSDSPFFRSSEHPIWTVCLLDLMVIADCLEGYPAWLPHYLRRRTRVLQQGYIASVDELDLFMHYLEVGLYFDDETKKGDLDQIYLGTWTDPLDHYYWYRGGIRKSPVLRPAPRVDGDLRRLVDRLDKCGVSLRLDAILRILDLSGSGRTQLMRLVKKVQKRYRKDGRAHDCSLAGPPGGGWGLSYFCAPNTPAEAERLATYVNLKRDELHVATWIGIADCSNVACGFWRVFRAG